MKKNYVMAVMLLIGILFSNANYAQTTGSFNDSVMFMSQQRLLSLYVPTTYNASNPYRLMVCLHGLGDNCANYRNSLVGGLAWGANISNTIFVCPEGYNVNTDYYYPAGDEAIIQVSIDYARQHYNIDTTDIILQGFSLGGRAALRYGLDNYSKFKGLLLNTPAVQGVKEAINAGGYNYTYANASHIPIYITHGETDIAYEAPIDSSYKEMVLNDGIVRYFQFPGLGHAIPPIAQIINFIPYFDSPTVVNYDADLVELNIAQRACVTSVPAACLLRNTGLDTIHSVTLHYTVNANNYTYTWNGTLASFQHAIVSLPVVNVPAGNQTLDVAIDTINASIADTITSNNAKIAPCQVVTQGTVLPLFEGFEVSVPPTNWVQYLAGDFYSPWFQDSTVMKTGYASMGAANTILLFDNAGRKEDIASPIMDLTSVANPNLRFDVAYNYHHYAPPVLTIDTIFADTLEVLISTDCGSTNTVLYKKGGTQLATFANPILNPTNLQAIFIAPADSNWRTEFIDLSSYGTYNEAILTFRYISALGGSVYIDNVNFSNTPLGISKLRTNNFRLYPNPANNIVNINTGDEAISNVEVIDMAGKLVIGIDNTGGGSELNVNTSAMAAGAYIFRIYSEHSVQTSKVIINR